MKRYVYSSQTDYTSLEEAHAIIDSIPMTEGRHKHLYAIEEWNVDPEDVAVLAGRGNSNGMIRFQWSSSRKVKSVSYGHSNKVYKAFVLEFEDGAKRLYGWDIETWSDGSEQKYWVYLGRTK